MMASVSRRVFIATFPETGFGHHHGCVSRDVMMRCSSAFNSNFQTHRMTAMRPLNGPRAFTTPSTLLAELRKCILL